MSELTDAIKAGDEAKMTALVDADPALLRLAENNVTPILFAMYHGQRALAQKLAARAEVTFVEACALGDRGRVEALLEGDPSLVNARSADGFPAAGLAIFFGHSELARMLFERGADVNAAAENAQRVAPVHAAAAVQDRATMEVLLARGADVHAKQQMEYTALHGAASRGDVEMAKLLLAHGADRDARASDGMRPADVARKYGHPEFAEWISI